MTDSVVVSDIISLAHELQIDYLANTRESKSSRKFVDIGETSSAFHLRIYVTNENGAPSQTTCCLGQQSISVVALHQADPHEHRSRQKVLAGNAAWPVVLTYSEVVEADLNKAVVTFPFVLGGLFHAQPG